MFNFQLPDGRIIFMQRLALKETFAGHMEGTCESVSAYIREHIHEDAKNMLSYAEPLAVIDIYGARLPRWMCVGEFESSRTSRSRNDDDASRLYICGFMEEDTLTLEEGIARILPHIPWDELAEDYESDLF